MDEKVWARVLARGHKVTVVAEAQFGPETIPILGGIKLFGFPYCPMT